MAAEETAAQDNVLVGGMVRRVLREPWQARAGREILFCLIGAAFGLVMFVVLAPLVLLTFILLAPLVGTLLAPVHRALAAWLLGVRIPARPGAPAGAG